MGAMPMNKRHKTSCEETTAGELVNMVQEEMSHLPLAEQDQRLTAFCQEVAASPHTLATVSESPGPAQAGKVDDGLSSPK